MPANLSTDTRNYTQFVVQTLFDAKWRSFGRYDSETPAQDIARQLTDEWGAQRVRILGGYFSEEKGRNVYHQIEIADKVRFRDTRAYKNSKFFIGSTALGAAMLSVFLLGYSFIAPISPMADDGRGSEQISQGQSTRIAPIAKPVNLRARFTEVIKVPYDKVWNFDRVPLRLRGAWSTACNTDEVEIVLGERELIPSEDASRTPLTSVWQTGQRYGLVRKGGSVEMVAMISADRLQKIGTMNRLGEFTADTTGAILNRCL
jgi:hypothetical protein